MENIIEQLNDQGIAYDILDENTADKIEINWKNVFINNKTAPYLDHYKWHIFSYNKDYNHLIEGDFATIEYSNQYPSDIYIFNERLTYCIKINKSVIPLIKMDDFTDDIYICHHNMKWTYVIPHEIPTIGPFFVKSK